VITAEKVCIICGHCQITIPGHLRVYVSEHATARPLNLPPPSFENHVLGDLQESVLFEMTDKLLCVKLVIVSLLEHNLNQQISLFNFRSFNSTRKVIIDEKFWLIYV